MHSVQPGTATSSLHCGKASRCYTSTWPPPPPPHLPPKLPISSCTIQYSALHITPLLYLLCALCLVCCQHKTTFTQNLHSYKLSLYSVFYKFESIYNELRQELNGSLSRRSDDDINDNQGACQKVSTCRACDPFGDTEVSQLCCFIHLLTSASHHTARRLQTTCRWVAPASLCATCYSDWEYYS